MNLPTLGHYRKRYFSILSAAISVRNLRQTHHHIDDSSVACALNETKFGPVLESLLPAQQGLRIYKVNRVLQNHIWMPTIYSKEFAALHVGLGYI